MMRACLPLSRKYSPMAHLKMSLASMKLELRGAREKRTYAGERSDVLQRSSLGSGGGNNNAVLHRIVLLKGFDKLGNSGSLLADSHVDAVELLGLIVGVVPSLLVQHSIESDGSLAGLTITNDQFTLTTANRHHGVDGFKTSLHWLVDRSAGKDTRSLQLRTTSLAGLDWALAINGIAEGIDNTTKHGLADGDIDLFLLADSENRPGTIYISQSGPYA